MNQYRGQHSSNSVKKVLPQFHTKLRKLHKHFPIWFESFWLTLCKTKKGFVRKHWFEAFQEKFTASFCCGFCGKWKVIENAETGGNWRKLWKLLWKIGKFYIQFSILLFLLCGSHQIFSKLWLLLILIFFWTTAPSRLSTTDSATPLTQLSSEHHSTCNSQLSRHFLIGAPRLFIYSTSYYHHKYNHIFSSHVFFREGSNSQQKYAISGEIGVENVFSSILTC